MGAAISYVKAAIISAFTGVIAFYFRPDPPPPPPTRRPGRNPPMVSTLQPIMEHPPRTDTPGVLAQAPPPPTTTTTTSASSAHPPNINTNASTAHATTTPLFRTSRSTPTPSSPLHLTADQTSARARHHALTDAKRACKVAIASRQREIARTEANFAKIAAVADGEERERRWALEMRWAAWLRRDLEGCEREWEEVSE